MPEALLIGIVVGLTASVVTGLFALGFIFRARSPTYIDGFVAAALTVSRIPRPTSALPKFAVQLFNFPLSATGKLVCANCHLASAATFLSLPQAVLRASLVEASIRMPCKRTTSQVSSSGSVATLNVGIAIVTPASMGLR